MAATSRSQIDLLGVRLRSGPPTTADLRHLDAYRQSFAGPYRVILDLVTGVLQLTPTGRQAKSTHSIVAKLRRERVRLSQMQDVAGMRVIVSDVQAQNLVLKELMTLCPGAAVVDRRLAPSHG